MDFRRQQLVRPDLLGAAQSSAINDNQQTSLQTTVSGSGSLSFWWKVSSEQWFDFLTFYIDGLQQLTISGEVDWQLESFNLPSGTHRLTWTYSKDASDSAGLDTGWVDQVAFVPDLPTVFQQPQDQTVSAGSVINLSVLAAGAPPLSYQWLKNGTNLVGQTSSSLTLANASRHDSGLYELVLSNANAVTLSSTAFVVVRVPELLSNPRWKPGGAFSFFAGDADAAGLWPSDLFGFQAQMSTNLVDWQPVNGALTITNGKLLLRDTSAGNFSGRFYRITETEGVSP